ncbi:MAG: phage Gp19/Gp15/Gp42 family protein [Solobacterium sp.]|nr:phage Gp19/Gp15/Gp42 family protein [Solobacterium sp.]
MRAFATVNDIVTLWRPLEPDEMTRAGALLPLVSDALRYEAVKVGMDLDAMIEESPYLANVAKLVTVDVVTRVMRQNTSGEPMSQESQAALGYSWSGTYAIPGGGIANAIMINDLKRLGLRRQKIGVIEPYDTGNNHHFD